MNERYKLWGSFCSNLLQVRTWGDGAGGMKIGENCERNLWKTPNIIC